LKKEDLEKYNLLKSKGKLSTNELFEFRRLSSIKRKLDFKEQVIPDFEKFSKKYGFSLDYSLEELFTLVLKRNGLIIFIAEEYQPRKMYAITFKFSIDKKRKKYNLSGLISDKESKINMELNCFKENEIITVLHFIEESLFKNISKSHDIKSVYTKFLNLRTSIKKTNK